MKLVSIPIPTSSKTDRLMKKTQIEHFLEMREKDENSGSPYQKMLMKQRKKIIASRLYKFKDEKLESESVKKLLKLQEKQSCLMYKEKFIKQMMGKERMGISVRERRLGNRSSDVSYILNDRRMNKTTVDS